MDLIQHLALLLGTPTWHYNAPSMIPTTADEITELELWARECSVLRAVAGDEISLKSLPKRFSIIKYSSVVSTQRIVPL
jgi:hypothetical protein